MPGYRLVVDTDQKEEYATHITDQNSMKIAE
jgi:hypothetical protein